MLTGIDLNDKTYEELLAEAITQIPLYSSEWTNYNVSDPGVTILQNLTAFSLLQRQYIDSVTDDIRRRLLKLVGFEAAQNRPARVLLSPESEDERLSLPMHRKLWAGGLCFETESEVTLTPCRVAGIYTEYRGEYRELTDQLDPRAPSGAAVFGPHPAAGMSLVCVFDSEPDCSRPFLLWAAAQDEEKRNPFAGDEQLSFAETRWQYYTDAGWTDVKAQDETRGFLVSGAVRLTLPENGALYSEAPAKGYAVRCVLVEQAYDLPPRLHLLSANLFEAVQRDTKSACFIFNGGARIELHSELAACGNILVFARENKGKCYRLYTEAPPKGGTGRYYIREDVGDGFILTFDKEFGHVPGRGWGAIRVVCYDDEIVHHRDMGILYGYDDQLITIDPVKHLIPDAFSVVAETIDADGEASYSFVNPGNTDPDTICYTVLSETGQIRVSTPGLGQDCRLWLADCAVTAGAGGNIRAGGTLRPKAMYEGVPTPAFHNPAPGRGGVSYESPEELRRRFVREMRRPTAAVLTSDCEALARSVPGLCIHKVRAVADEKENLVKIAIKPYTEEEFPRMSPLYLEQIRRFLEPRRMLTTRFELVQPKYVPVHVKATVYVKGYFEDARQEIEDTLRRQLDCIRSDAPFGAPIRFNEVYRRLETLPCVETVFDLKLTTAGRADVKMVGADICPGDMCLCYPGQISLELSAAT